MSEIQKFGGTWKIYEKETLYQGELHINYDTNIIALEMILPASENNPMPRPPYKGKIPYICGELFSGAKILLYDCSTGKEHSHFMSYTQQVIYARYAFWGLHVNSEEDIRFNKIVFDFGNIIAWSGLCNYNWEFSGEVGSNLIWFHKEPVSFELRKGLKITFFASQGSVGGDMYEEEIVAKQSIFVEFEYKNSVSWQSILEDAICIQYLIGLGVSQKVEISKIKYYHETIYSEYSGEDESVEKIYHPADAIIGTGSVETVQNTKLYDCLYTLNDLIQINVFSNWSRNYSKLRPVLDLYFSAFSGKAGTPEMLFLNLVQALETYHARFVTDNVTEYLARVDELIDSFYQGSENGSQWREFLCDDGQIRNTKTIFLRSRLADLIFADGILPFWPSRYPKDKYIRKIVDTRNYYTHYNPKKIKKAFTKEELPWINGHLLALLEYHILVLIGFENDIVRKKTVEKINRIDESYNIQRNIHAIER